MSENSLSPPPISRHLLRVLGVGFGLAVTIGNTIGAGILRTPGEVASRLPDPAWFLGAWIAGGLYALLGACSLAELGVLLPHSGGQYVFARRAFGDYVGFIVGWSDWVSTCGSSAAVSIVIAESMLHVFGRSGSSVPMAIAVVLAVTLLQWRGIRWGKGAQEITGLLKTLAFIALIAACFLFGDRVTAGTSARPVQPLLLAFVVALQSVIYTYDGWAGVVYFSEEVRQPSRDIPRSMFLGVIAVMAIYLLVNGALLYLLPIDQIAREKLAVAAAAGKVFGSSADLFITVIMIVSMVSAVNAYQLMAPRVLFAMSRDGLFTARGTEVNRGGTPTMALAISAAIAVGFILSGAFDAVIAVLAFFFVANYTISFAALFALRLFEPNMPRPYRAWGYPWTTAIALLGSIAFLVSAVVGDTKNSVRALVLLAVSYPVYRVIRWLAKVKREG